MKDAGSHTQASAQDKKSGKFAMAKRAISIIFFIAVPVFLVALIRKVNWVEVRHAMGEFEVTTLCIALATGLFSYVVYSSYDLVGRKYTGHNLPVRSVLAIAFVCYAFTLNLGAWAGTFALRFRLYSRLGLDTPTITKIFSLSIITNWLGYLLLAGTIFSCGLIQLPDNWKIGGAGLRVLGMILLIAPVLYVFACKYAKRRSWKIRGQKFTLPSVGFALVQCAIASLNWSLMALILFILFKGQVFYPLILGGLLLSSIAGALTHIPGGLGVLETIFVTLLSSQHFASPLSKGSILATLIGYRVIYYLIPLAIAVAIYLVVEGRAKKMTRAVNSDKTQQG